MKVIGLILVSLFAVPASILAALLIAYGFNVLDIPVISGIGTTIGVVAVVALVKWIIDQCDDDFKGAWGVSFALTLLAAGGLWAYQYFFK